MQPYKLEKSIWTEADFEKMGWHDCRIYKMSLSDELVMDIDYILQWNEPELEGLPFTFWVAPATLVFTQVKNLTFETDTAWREAIEIDEVEMTDNEGVTEWTIITHQGYFSFKAGGYVQYIRQEPFFQFGQTISFLDRNGFSLERITNQENPMRTDPKTLARQRKDFEDYENAKKRHLKRIEYNQLQVSRDNNELDLKTYLTKKNEIKELIDYYDYWLKETRFEDW